MFSIEQYLEAKRLGARHTGKAASAKTLKSYEWALQRCERLLDKPLWEFDTNDGERLLSEMDAANFSSATRAQLLAAGKGIFAWAIATNRHNEANPFEGITKPTIKRTLPTILSKSEVKRFLTCFESDKYCLFFSLMYYCGLRIGEVCKIRHEDILPTSLKIQGKGNKQRLVPVPEAIMTKLVLYSRAHRDSQYVFYGESSNGDPSSPITLDAAYKAFHKAKFKANLTRDLHPHNLRHTSATHLQKSARDITVVQKFLGHSNISTTMIYAQIADEDVASASIKAFG
jgi:integrase/recombinase XerD